MSENSKNVKTKALELVGSIIAVLTVDAFLIWALLLAPIEMVM